MVCSGIIPNMPWDGTELWVGELGTDGFLAVPREIAGSADESIFQPEWSPDGSDFVSDRTGWWNLYRAAQRPLSKRSIRCRRTLARRNGRSAQSTYAFVDAIGLSPPTRETAAGTWRSSKRIAELRADRSGARADGAVRADARAVYLHRRIAHRLARGRADVACRHGTRGSRASSADRIEPAWISVPEAVTYKSQGEDVFTPSTTRRKALTSDRQTTSARRSLVLSHGGPTDQASDVLDPRIQFWTSRGFAVLDVNYGGSSGFGRAYRDRLKGQWGIVDVADCVNGATSLVEAGKADPNRLIIRGGSAGGYTTLAALTFHDVFKAGASYYGISDIEVLARDTHKFESRYLDSLVGPYPEAKDVYIKRSPIHFSDRLSCPLILFQGLEDKVVPPNQSEMMADAVQAQGTAGRLRHVRRRATWLPQRGEHHPKPGSGAVFLRRGVQVCGGGSH